MNGFAGNGSAAANYLVMYGLEFFNGSSDRFAIDVDFAYDLSVNTVGETVVSEIFLDYWEELTGEGFFDELSMSATSSDYSSGGRQFSFTLEAFEKQQILADVKHSGTVSAVPVPAAFWLFGSALFGLVANSLRKRANC